MMDGSVSSRGEGSTSVNSVKLQIRNRMPHSGVITRSDKIASNLHLNLQQATVSGLFVFGGLND